MHFLCLRLYKDRELPWKSTATSLSLLVYPVLRFSVMAVLGDSNTICDVGAEAGGASPLIPSPADSTRTRANRIVVLVVGIAVGMVLWLMSCELHRVVGRYCFGSLYYLDVCKLNQKNYCRYKIQIVVKTCRNRGDPSQIWGKPASKFVANKPRSWAQITAIPPKLRVPPTQNRQRSHNSTTSLSIPHDYPIIVLSNIEHAREYQKYRKWTASSGLLKSLRVFIPFHPQIHFLYLHTYPSQHTPHAKY